MSGYKKFANKTSIASICIEFDAKTGAISKAIPVTADGKASGLSGIPTVSKQVESISSKMKIFAANQNSRHYLQLQKLHSLQQHQQKVQQKQWCHPNLSLHQLQPTQ